MPLSQISTVPAPYSPGRDHALEVRIVERVVLDVHREMALAAAQRDALRDGPARERTVALEPEVVVEAPRGVALNHEPDGRSAPSPDAPNGSGVLPRLRFLRYWSRLTCGLSPETQRFFTNRLQDALFPCSGRFRDPGISLWNVGKTPQNG